MTIRNPDKHAQYVQHNEAYGGPTTYAKVVNEAFEEFERIATEYGLDLPKDDEAENLVAEMFATLWDHNHG